MPPWGLAWLLVPRTLSWAAPLFQLSPWGGRCRQPRAEVCPRFYYPTSTLTHWSPHVFLPPTPKKRNEEEKRTTWVMKPQLGSEGLEVGNSPGQGGRGMPQGSWSSIALLPQPKALSRIRSSECHGTEQALAAGWCFSESFTAPPQAETAPQAQNKPRIPKRYLGCGARLAP